MNKNLQREGSRHESVFISPKALFLTRAASLIWTVLILIVALSRFEYPIWNFFRYITNWSWIGLMFFFLIATINSYRRVFLNKNIDFFPLVFDVLFASIIALPWFVSLGYWGLLSAHFGTQTEASKFILANTHAVNFLLMMLEIILSRCKPTVSRFVCPVLFIWMYTSYTVFLKLQFGFDWPYPQMQVLLQTSLLVSVMAYLIVAAATALFYFVSFGICRYRDRFIVNDSVCSCGNDCINGCA